MKYVFTENKMNYCGHILRQIEAVEVIGVEEGTRGGWIESEKNLSRNEWSEAWVDADSKVMGDSEIGKHGVVENSVIKGDSFVGGHVVNSTITDSIVVDVEDSTINNCELDGYYAVGVTMENLSIDTHCNIFARK